MAPASTTISPMSDLADQSIRSQNDGSEAFFCAYCSPHCIFLMMPRDENVAPLMPSIFIANASSDVFPFQRVSSWDASAKKSGVSEFFNALTLIIRSSFK